MKTTDQYKLRPTKKQTAFGVCHESTLHRDDYLSECSLYVTINRMHVDFTLAVWSGGMRKVLLQLSTGGGKTIIFAAVASEFTCRSEGVLVVAHREELILQAADKLAATTSVQPGIIKAGYKPTDSLIQVGSIQTKSAS